MSIYYQLICTPVLYCLFCQHAEAQMIGFDSWVLVGKKVKKRTNGVTVKVSVSPGIGRSFKNHSFKNLS